MAVLIPNLIPKSTRLLSRKVDRTEPDQTYLFVVQALDDSEGKRLGNLEWGYIRLHGKVNSNSHGARPVNQDI